MADYGLEKRKDSAKYGMVGVYELCIIRIWTDFDHIDIIYIK